MFWPWIVEPSFLSSGEWGRRVGVGVRELPERFFFFLRSLSNTRKLSSFLRLADRCFSMGEMGTEYNAARLVGEMPARIRAWAVGILGLAAKGGLAVMLCASLGPSFLTWFAAFFFINCFLRRCLFALLNALPN